MYSALPATNAISRHTYLELDTPLRFAVTYEKKKHQTNRLNDLFPVGMSAQLVRVLHRYRRGQRVRISYKPEFFFFRLSFRGCKRYVYKCDDLLYI